MGILINVCMDIIDFESAYKCLHTDVTLNDIFATVMIVSLSALCSVIPFLIRLLSDNSFIISTEAEIAISAFLCNLTLIAFVYVIGVQQGYFVKYEKLIYKRMIFKNKSLDNGADDKKENDEIDNLP